MSSQASLARLQGIRVQLATDGEDLTYGESDAAIRGTVDRNVDPNKQPQMPSFNVNDIATIMVLKTAMAEPPGVGGAFYDAFGHAYRIETVKRREWDYFCTCKGSDVTVE